MSRLDELIAKLCPDGVEQLPLNSVLKICNGKDYKHLNEGAYPVYGSGGIMKYVDKFTYDKPSVLIPRKGSIDKLYYVDIPFWTVDTIFYTIINTCIAIPKYIFYVLQKAHLEDLNMAGGVPSLTQSVLNKVIIPIPPLPVQREIVRILDTFTELTAELTAELEARKKQYECYRNNILSLNKKYIINKSLNEVADLFRGEYITKSSTRIGTIPVILGGQEPAYYIDRYNHEGEIIVVARSGASAGFVSYWNEQIYITDGFGFEAKANTIIPKYLYYVLKSKEKCLNSMKRGAGVPHISGEMLGKIIIPIPDLKKQKEIVSILDRFDNLCNNISNGLPAEITSRQKQYEYYRDKLLNFKRIVQKEGNTI